MGIETKKETYEERLYELTQEYTISDITRALDSELSAAGLLLMPAFGGMIALGHVLYGFEIDDRVAFLKFARHRMRIDKGLAEILYDNVYAGLKISWCSIIHILLVVRHDAMFGSDCICSQDPFQENVLVINALKVAEAYISAVNGLPEYSRTKRRKKPDKVEAHNPQREQVARFLASCGEVD